MLLRIGSRLSRGNWPLPIGSSLLIRLGTDPHDLTSG